MMIVGIAAYLRRFLPATPESLRKEPVERPRAWWGSFGPVQVLPYLLIIFLFLVLIFNVLSLDKNQQNIRPTLIIVTFLVVGLVIARQIITLLENERLVREQIVTLEKLEMMHQDVTKRNAELETGIIHLKDIQTRLANGDVRMRAHITQGDLWPLAVGLNLMADRMMRSEQSAQRAQKVEKAIYDFNNALDRHTTDRPFVLPASCYDIPDIHRLMRIIGSKQILTTSRSVKRPASP
jgi:hypothetical protein